MEVGAAAPLILKLQEQQRRKADPLAYWQPKSWAQRALLSCWRLFAFLDEVYWHASNSGGKTDGCAALAVSLLQCRKEVAGIALPEMPEVSCGVLLVHSYKQAVLSSIKAIREKLGAWPYHEVMASDDCPGVIYVKPIGSREDDHRLWSRLLIFPRDGEIPDGLRLNFAWADEPPDEKMWRELRWRATSGMRFIRFIGATPKLKRFWGWLLDDFVKACGRVAGREDTWESSVNNSRLRIQSTIYDNKALTAADIARAERDAENDPEKDARLMGEHVDATGQNPWSLTVLARWAARCVDHKPWMLTVQREKDMGQGKRLVGIECEVQVWEKPDYLDSYYIPLDPAKGIGKDPDGLHVWSIKHNRLVARLNVSIGGYGLGMAAAIIARHYNNALVDPAVTGGYGEAIFSALRDSDYWNINRQQYWDRTTNAWASRLGFDEGGEFAGKIRGAIDRAIITDACEIPSRDVIDCLRHCQYDENGKIVGEAKYHDEDLVLAGRAQLFMADRPEIVTQESKAKLDFEDSLARSMGHRVPDAEYAPEPVVIERW